MSNQDEQKKKPTPHISDMILSSLKPRTGKETSKWIAGLADENMTEAVEAAAHNSSEEESAQAPANAAASSAAQSSAAVQAALKNDNRHDVVHLMDHIFDCFQQYEYDFNRTVAGTDLVISIERAQWATETIKHRFQPTETVQVFRGRISTRQWTLLLRGRHEFVEGWIMPIEKIISFSADNTPFVRFLYMEAKARNGGISWSIDGVDIHWDNVRLLAKQLFGSLVKVGRGEASDSEPFTLRPKAAVDRSYENLAMITPDPAKPASYSFNERNPNFEGYTPNAGGNGGVKQPVIRAVEKSVPPAPGESPSSSSLKASLKNMFNDAEAAARTQTGERDTEHTAATQPIAVNMPNELPAIGASAPQDNRGAQLPPQNLQNTPTPSSPGTAPVVAQTATTIFTSMQPAGGQPTTPPAAAAPAAAAPAAAAHGPTTPAASAPAAGSPSTAPQSGLSNAEQIEIETVLEMLNRAVKVQLDKLSKVGAEAFARQDLAAVEQAMKRASLVKDLQSEIGSQVAQWKERLHDAVEN